MLCLLNVGYGHITQPYLVDVCTPQVPANPLNRRCSVPLATGHRLPSVDWDREKTALISGIEWQRGLALDAISGAPWGLVLDVTVARPGPVGPGPVGPGPVVVACCMLSSGLYRP
jgi:hypothetical protein